MDAPVPEQQTSVPITAVERSDAGDHRTYDLALRVAPPVCPGERIPQDLSLLADEQASDFRGTLRNHERLGDAIERAENAHDFLL